MTVTPSMIQADFDRIAPFEHERWSHNSQYHGFLLRHVRVPCREALDVGCGAGTFTRLLAERSGHVLGLDLSPGMLQVARERAAGIENVDFELADVTTYELPPGYYDCIASLTTFHHLPLEQTLEQMKQALRPGGVLLVLDLFQAAGLREDLIAALGFAPAIMLGLIHGGRLRQPAAARAAWDAHGQHDVYPSVAQVRRACAAHLPGVRVRQHLLWRYSIVWRKPY